ncbi:hypothetical protein [Sebaldella sp. S0638]|uniref:hypothetical protein n=1 Tax=Sebaldella sp. S0638 TaxID=2957809 RepID=UPI0020A13163|nr:hypothetical protein [Sebaldella sp. S0638]MCP1224852.1 hypothetical protein [Sebaldella sp. S0638]
MSENISDNDQKTSLKSFRLKEKTIENILELTKVFKLTQAEVIDKSVDFFYGRYDQLEKISKTLHEEDSVTLYNTTDYNMYTEFYIFKDENAKKNGYTYSCHFKINDLKPIHLYIRKISDLYDLGLNKDFNMAKKNVKFNFPISEEK